MVRTKARPEENRLTLIGKLNAKLMQFGSASSRSVDCELVTKDEVVTVLKDCYDPEIPINIWDLGLVYGIDITDEGSVGIKMTLTAPGCMMGGMIADEVKAKIKAMNGVKDAKVDLVWDPPWTPDKMSEEAKAQMGIA
jgi:FeS assembly SUF system protein